MATPASRSQLKEFALRNLGKPVIEINVDDAQLEDRLDEVKAIYNENGGNNALRGDNNLGFDQLTTTFSQTGMV